MLWLGVLLACAFWLLGMAVVAQRSWLSRRLRRPLLVLVSVVVLCVLAVPSSVAVAISTGGAWQPYLVGVEVCALVGSVAAVLGSQRVPVVSSGRRRVLVVGAHPDDLELACGGSLARFADRGHEVRAVVMSRGERGGHPGRREHEARCGADRLELAGVSVQEFTDTKLATEIDQMVRVLEMSIELFCPDVILTHSAHDQHQDHHAVHLATLRAGRRCPTILCFESPSVTSDFVPRYFVDIADYLDIKIAAVAAHTDQQDKPYMGAQRLRGAAVFRGAQAKTSHAEGFEVIRALSSGLGEL